MVAAYIKGQPTRNLKIQRILTLKSNVSIEYYKKKKSFKIAVFIQKQTRKHNIHQKVIITYRATVLLVKMSK
jgi:hypothetical protein